MSRKTVLQPNGRYAIYSTVVDDFIITDATKEEYIEFCLDEYKKELVELLLRQDLMTWEDALNYIVSHHGKEAIKDYV